MDNENKDITRESAEQDFKNKLFNAFSKKIPDTYCDENGFIVIPVTQNRKSPRNSNDSNKQNN